MSGARRRWLVPEVVQSSAMDCGPAALKSLLEGFGISVGYGRLREACQTHVDGTSIDALEELAGQLGLEAEQVIQPVDHVFDGKAELLPALAVVTEGNGMTHFIVIWRRHGPLVQIMDPAIGRRWVHADWLRARLYRHEAPVPATAFREWATSVGFLEPLRARLARIGIHSATRAELVDVAVGDPGWRRIAALDSAVRLVDELCSASVIKRGAEAARLVAKLVMGADPLLDRTATARPDSATDDGDEQVRVRGAVLVTVSGRRTGPSERQPPSTEIAAALTEPSAQPLRDLWRLGQLGPAARWLLALAIGAAASATICEAVLWRAFIDVSRDLGFGVNRVLAPIAFVLFLGALACLDTALLAGLLWAGRRLETQLRIAFLEKIPRLGDRYFHSRLSSDMAERSQSIHRIRAIPALVGDGLRAAVQLLFTVAGILWIAPAQLTPVLLGAGAALGVPLATLPWVRERDMRVRVHAGAIMRFYLDALLGVVALRAHGAESAMRQGHEALAVEWAHATRRSGWTAAVVDGAQTMAGLGGALWLIIAYVTTAGIDGRVLLLAYWALLLPVLGQGLAHALHGLAVQRNLLIRLLEPLGAPHDSQAGSAAAPVAGPAARLAFRDVSIVASGHTLVAELNVEIPSGAHVAIVGASGAGKSSLIGLLLGFHRPAKGEVWIDDAPLEPARLPQLRAEAIWLEPAVQLWNRSLLENVLYGSAASAHAIESAIDTAELRALIGKLAAGMQTPLGESGACVSGGEGQRVRLARALVRPAPRLVLLDEPFRGLDRERRRRLLRAMVKIWRGTTLLCVTHDVGETALFDRVLVMDGGRLVEDGAPAELALRPDSRYRALLDAEAAVAVAIDGGAEWRRISVDAGRVVEGPRRP